MPRSDGEVAALVAQNEELSNQIVMMNEALLVLEQRLAVADRCCELLERLHIKAISDR